MFKEVSKTHPLALGLASPPCGKEYCLNCSGEGCLEKPVAVYRDSHMHAVYELHILRSVISERAYASGKSCFCRDIRNFSILEYSLAHLAWVVGLTFSFATCVRSMQDENRVLVLEFLLLPGSYDMKSITLLMRSLLTKIKELLPRYVVAGEDFPGEELFPGIYGSLNDDETDHPQGGDSLLSWPVTRNRSCDGHEKAVDLFLPLNLSYETIGPYDYDDFDDDSYDKLVFWTNDVEKCDGVDEHIKHVLTTCISLGNFGADIIQFWALRKTTDRSFLTTLNQPFAIRKGIIKVSCMYMIECMSQDIHVDENNGEQLGPAGRAFKHGVVEYSPNVRLYTIQEFPLRDHAVLWGTQKAMFLPVFEHEKGTVGVLGILFDFEYGLGRFLECITEELQKRGLTTDYVHSQPGQSDSLAEIEKIFEAVYAGHPLQFARALTPCLSDHCHNNSSQGYISRIWSRPGLFKVDEISKAGRFHQLVDKIGVAGKALASRRSCFCMNISIWGVKDYSISHYAELFGCNFSVAVFVENVCVENTQLSDTPYVLEFFMLPGDYSNKCIRDLLNSLLMAVKKHLPPNFKIVPENVPGESFFLEIGKNLENGNKVIISGVATNPLVPQENDSDIDIADYLENISGLDVVDGTEAPTLAVQGEVIYEMQASDGIVAPPIPQGENTNEVHIADAIEATPQVPQGENISSILSADEQRPIAETRPISADGSTIPSTRKKIKKICISREEIERHYGKTKQGEAAKNLGVSPATIKRRRNEYGMARWPSSKGDKANPSLCMKQNRNDAPVSVGKQLEVVGKVMKLEHGITFGVTTTRSESAITPNDPQIIDLMTCSSSALEGLREYYKTQINHFTSKLYIVEGRMRSEGLLYSNKEKQVEKSPKKKKRREEEGCYTEKRKDEIAKAKKKPIKKNEDRTGKEEEEEELQKWKSKRQTVIEVKNKNKTKKKPYGGKDEGIRTKEWVVQSSGKDSIGKKTSPSKSSIIWTIPSNQEMYDLKMLQSYNNLPKKDTYGMSSRMKNVDNLVGEEQKIKEAAKVVNLYVGDGLSWLARFPCFLKPYIQGFSNVERDGHCGFRAVSHHVLGDQDSWMRIRYELFSELGEKTELYEKTYMFNTTDSIRNALSWWTETPCDETHWMDSDMGFIIATRYNKVFVLISEKVLQTYLPLVQVDSTPIDGEIVVFHSNNHFIALEMSMDFPLPPISIMWPYVCTNSVAQLPHFYQPRLTKYIAIRRTQSLHSNPIKLD